MRIVPSGRALAAEIRQIDLRDLSAAGLTAIHAAWRDHLVLLFRNQHLTDDDLIAFSRRFGDLVWAPIQEAGRRFVEGNPAIYLVSNVIENGAPTGSHGAGEAVWHTDMSYLEDPPKASMLYSLEILSAGGNRYFCNLYAAYECLPIELQQQIRGFSLKRGATYSSGYVRQGGTPVDDPQTSSGVYHSLVGRDPETGHKALYLGRRTVYIAGLPLEESEVLLEELWPRATRDEFTWHTERRVGDVVLWDNRCTMYRRDPFDSQPRRILHRTQIKGERRPST